MALFANGGKDHQAKVQAGKIIQAIVPIVGGKDVAKVDEALAEAARLVQAAGV